MRRYEAYVDVFKNGFGNEEVQTFVVEGENGLEARDNLRRKIEEGEIKLPAPCQEFYIWEIQEDQLVQ